MSKPLKIVAGVVVALLLAAGAMLAYLAANFDPNDYKPVAIERVQRDYHRTLAIPGPVELAFWPDLGVKLGAASLSEPDGRTPFASLRSAHVSLAIWPLLSGKVVVHRITLDGLSASLTRLPDGRLSIDDLLGTPAAKAGGGGSAATTTAGAAPAFDVAGIAVTDARLRFDDRQGGRRIELAPLELQTGRLAPGTPTELHLKTQAKASSPDADVALTVDGRLLFEAGHLEVDDLEARLDGRVLERPGSSLKLALPRLELRERVLSAPRLALDAQLGGAAPVQLKLDADLAGTLGAGGAITLPRLVLGATLPGPRGAIDLAAQGSGRVRPDTQDAELQLAGTIDGSRFKASAGVLRFSPLQTRFDLDVDRLDLDRYRAPAPAAAASSPAADVPVDLAALRELRSQGTLRVGTLRVAGLQLGELRATLKAADGRMAIDPLQARLYDGSVSGSLRLDASAGAPRVALAQTLAGVQLGPLLKDLLGRAPLIDGRGSVDLDVDAQGASVMAMRRSLAGRAKLALVDGAVHGFNVAQAIRDAKARVGLGGGASGGTGSAAERTDFSELGGSFVIAHGVAHNDDLQAKSPLLRIGGSGDVDLANERLDYTVKATVVGTLQGQGGPELQALSGQTIPVRLSGPFSAIGWHVDFAGLAKDLARQKVGEKAKAELQERLKKLFGR